MRGEYVKLVVRFSFSKELPPRARRIPKAFSCLVGKYGTTSACAENTVAPFRLFRVHGNYLRVRGEYPTAPSGDIRPSELPPRARRIQFFHAAHGPDLGTTSACAENTQTPSDSTANPGNYLRVRGEYLGGSVYRITVAELPPRARRILLVFVTVTFYRGTTSACAENTLNELGLL